MDYLLLLPLRVILNGLGELNTYSERSGNWLQVCVLLVFECKLVMLLYCVAYKSVLFFLACMQFLTLSTSQTTLHFRCAVIFMLFFFVFFYTLPAHLKIKPSTTSVLYLFVCFWYSSLNTQAHITYAMINNCKRKQSRRRITQNVKKQHKHNNRNAFTCGRHYDVSFFFCFILFSSSCALKDVQGYPHILHTALETHSYWDVHTFEHTHTLAHLNLQSQSPAVSHIHLNSHFIFTSLLLNLNDCSFHYGCMSRCSCCCCISAGCCNKKL